MAKGAHILPDEWPVLLADAPDEDRRQAADAHAEACPLCASTRRQGEQLLAELDAQRPVLLSANSLRAAVSSIDADLLRSSTRRALQEKVATKPTKGEHPDQPDQRQAQVVLWEAGLALGTFAVLVAFARHHNGGTLPILAAIALAVLGACIAPAVRRRPGLFSWLALAAFPLPFLGMHSWQIELGHAAGCALSAAFGAVLPLGVLTFFHFRRGLSADPLAWGAAALAGGVAALGALALTCPSEAAGHILCFHVLVAFALALAATQIPRLLPAPAPAQ